ncbi:hypothetical protein ACFL4D_02820 [Candidatus Margulisiibacteriota bacterium]
MLEKELRGQQAAFEDNIYAAVFSGEHRAEEKREEHVGRFISRLVRLLPQIGADEDKIIQIEVLVALSVEGIINTDNLSEKAPMIKAICEMIKFDHEKKDTAVSVAKKLLQ